MIFHMKLDGEKKMTRKLADHDRGWNNMFYHKKAAAKCIGAGIQEHIPATTWMLQTTIKE